MYALGESPWICQNDVSMALSFAVGRQQCRVNLNLVKGNIVQEICQRLFNEENIPAYLQCNIMDAVIRIVQEASLSVVPLSEDILDVGLMIEQARLLSRQFDVTTTVSQELANAFVTSYGAVDITWSLKPNPNFAAELGRTSASPTRSRPSTPSHPSVAPSRPELTSDDFLDAKRMINSGAARGARTPQQSMHLAKMYHFLVAGDQSVTPSSGITDDQPQTSSNSSLIDGDYGFGGSSSGPILEPTIVKHGSSGSLTTNPTRSSQPQYYRKKKQAGGAELLLLQDTTNEFRDMIAELEKSLAQSQSQLTQAKEAAISSLSDKHAREMDRASLSGNLERIPQLVEKHMSEMDGLEAKWQVELLEARKRQRREYYAFCSDLYKNRERYLEDKRAMGPQKVSALVRQQLADASKPSAASGLAAYGSWTSLIFGKAASTSSGSEKVIRIASHNSSLMMARETTHDHGTYSIVVMLGSQLKVPFEVQVYGGGGMLSQGNIGNVAQLTPTAASHHVQLSHGDNSSDSIYSSNLTAMVLIADPSMACDSPTYADFFALASLSTELHFESAHDQIEAIRSQVLPPSEEIILPYGASRTPSAPPQKLQPGDFFVTTHSNLGKVQVVFHMVGERQNMEQSWPQLLAGLKNIMTVASHYDITTLSVPIHLVEPEFKHLYTDGQGIKRAEEVVRAMRSFLVLNSATGTSLKVIRLVCPPSTQPGSSGDSDSLYFDKVKGVVSTLFNQPLH